MIVSPVYINKWQFYMNKLNVIDNASCSDDIVKFSWFSCGKPFIQNDKNVLQIDRYATLFDNSTGTSYNITFDATDGKTCTLLMVDEQNFDTINYTESLNQGYQGIVYRKNIESSPCDLVCPEVHMMIDPNVLRKSKMCPYIMYAKTHYPILSKSNTTILFPSKKELNSAKPGKMSLKLKKILVPFFT
jgi:hypothetical protein